MTEEPDLIDAYLRILFGGAKADDPRFDLLLADMTPEQIQETQKLVGDVLRRQVTPLDFADLSIELIRRGAKADDPRLAMLLGLMSLDELQRGRLALGEIWLRREPVPELPN